MAFEEELAALNEWHFCREFTYSQTTFRPAPTQEKWRRLFERFSPIYKWTPGGLAKADVSLSRLWNGDLVLRLPDGAALTVQQQYADPANRIERIAFADGTTIEAAEVDALPAGQRSANMGSGSRAGRSSGSRSRGRC